MTSEDSFTTGLPGHASSEFCAGPAGKVSHLGDAGYLGNRGEKLTGVWGRGMAEDALGRAGFDAPGGSKPISASESMVLPLPDSPTSPGDSPAAMRSDTSFTGFTQPAAVGSSTVTSRMSRRESTFTSYPALPVLGAIVS